MNIWHSMSPKRINPSGFITVVEISKGSKEKHELDKETDLTILDHILYASAHYPADCGFIPRTCDDNHNPLGALVFCSEPLEPHTLVRCFPIGVTSMLDGGRNDEKIVAIPFNDPTYDQHQSISELPTHIFDEMSHFSRVYKELESRETAVKGVSGREETVRVIKTMLDSYVGNFYK